MEGRVRRFEFVQGNQAKFWEVARRGASLTVASGKIGGQAKSRTKQLADYMAAEQEFDRLIRDKLRRGYVEVQQASEPEPPMPDRWLSLVPLDGSAPLELKPAAARYLIWRMVEVGVMDKQAPPPDLGRWAERASRRMRLPEVPAQGSEQYNEFRTLFLELSAGDRATELDQHGVVGAYKWAQGSDWIVTGKESAWLAEGARTRVPRRHKIAANAQQWLDDWIAFHERVADVGYTVQLRTQSAPRPAPQRRAAPPLGAPAAGAAAGGLGAAAAARSPIPRDEDEHDVPDDEELEEDLLDEEDEEDEDYEDEDEERDEDEGGFGDF